MVQAAYNYTNTSLARPLEQPEQQERRLRKVRRKKNIRERMVVKIGIFIFCYALLLVFLCTSGASLNYQVISLEKDIEGLQTSNSRLEYEIAQGTSLDQIEKAAGKDLGMHKPDLKLSMVAPVSKTEQVTPPVQVQAQPQSQSDQGTLEKIYSALLMLADKNN
jgi:cell division protein FtsL